MVPRGVPLIVTKDTPWIDRLRRLVGNADGIDLRSSKVSEEEVARPEWAPIRDSAVALMKGGNTEVLVARQGQSETVDHVIDVLTGFDFEAVADRYGWREDTTTIIDVTHESGQMLAIAVGQGIANDSKRMGRGSPSWFAGGMKAHRKSKARGKR